jgi:flavorubredoxin
MTEVFKSRAIAVGSPTMGNDILSSVAGWLYFLKELKMKNKKAAVFGCYGWSGESNKILREKLTEAGFEVVEPEVRVNWNPLPENLEEMNSIAQALV